MAVKNLTFSIKVPPWGTAAQKDASKLTTELKAQDKATKTLVEATKQHAKGVGEASRSWEKFSQAGVSAARSVGTALKSTASAVDQVTGKLEGAVRKVFSFKNAILGSVIGAGAYKLGESILSEGRQQLRGESRARREFGFMPGNSLIDRAKGLGLASGVQSDEALSALTPIQEVIQAGIMKGSTFGGKRLRTSSDLAAAKDKATAFSSDLLKRIITLHPELDTDTIGQGLAAAGSGPEGFRMFAGQLGFRNPALLKRVREKVAKNGLGTGDAINELLNTFGDSEGAADAKRKSFDFQMKSIKAQLTDTLGDAGVAAMSALNKKFGEGETLAQKLTKAIESPRGQAAVQKIGDGLARMVGFAADLALKIPDAFGWIEDHKTTLLAVAAGYGAIKTIQVGAGVVGQAQSAWGWLGKVGGGGGGIPGVGGGAQVFVTNWPAAMGGTGPGSAPGLGGAGGVASKLGGVAQSAVAFLGAAAVGVELGTLAGNYLDKNNKTANKFYTGAANGLYGLTGEGAADKKLEDFEASRNQGQLASIKRKRDAEVATLRSQGLSEGQALYLADHHGGTVGGANAKGQPINITLTMDGHVVSKVVTDHMGRAAKNATAGGAAR